FIKEDLSLDPMIQESELGKRIKEYRMQRGLTLQKLEEKTGFTKGYLSKVENTKKAPPVSTLIVLAKALKVSLSEIFGEKGEKSSISLVKRNERQVVARNGTVFGYSYQTLAHKFYRKHMEPYILTLPVKPKQVPLYQHEGEEILFVLEGTMKFFHGELEFIAEEGDCLYFDASIPHHGICQGKKEVKCLMVIYTPE
ncbi:MAG: helix-turn-helix domain-containing protein, partial [Thermodesulfobacteriota bacterium]